MMDENKGMENSKEEMTYEEFGKLPKHGSETPTVILQLLEERPMRAEELAEKLNLTRGTVIYHLRKIKDQVVQGRKGKKVYWGLKSKMVKEV